MRLNYIYFDEDIGYGIAARTMIEALREQGVTVYETRLVTRNPQDGGYVLQDRYRSDVDGVIIHTMPEYFPYWLKQRKADRPDVQVWGYTTWETDHIPSHWPKLLDPMDGVFVTSTWNQEVFAACGVRCPIRVLPHVSQFHGQAPAQPTAALKQLTAASEGKYVFYHIGAWSERKAIDELLHAYLKQFSSQDPVLLVLKTGDRDWSSYRPRWRRLRRPPYVPTADKFHSIIRHYADSAPVLHLSGALSDDDMAALHQIGDCFVSLTRGEGWGMGAYEAAWFGNAVAITSFSGHLDFLPAEMTYPIPYELRNLNRMPRFMSSYERNHRWAYVQENDARAVFRNIAEQPGIAAEKGQRLQQFMKQHYTPSSIVARCLEVFR